MASQQAEEPIQRIPDDEGLMVQQLFQEFLENFTVDEEEEDGSSSQANIEQKEYVIQCIRVLKSHSKTLYVNFQHVHKYSSDLALKIQLQYTRFYPWLCAAVQNFIQKTEEDLNPEIGDIKDYVVAFWGIPVVVRIRDLRTNLLQQLTSVKCTVTRTSEVRPELLNGWFKCNMCGTIVRDVEQEYKYEEPTKCSNPECDNTNGWHLQHKQSRWGDWQKLHVQENTEEIPAGSMPRHIDVILRGDIVEQAKAGDRCVFTGALVAVPDVAQLYGGTIARKTLARQPGGADGSGGLRGLKALGVRELNWKLIFIASSVQPAHSRFGSINIRDESEEDILDTFTEEERRDILSVKEIPSGVYNAMTKSIAPTIYGHDDIKRGILLMLFGGVHKKTPEGINIRGDLNICIVGDPSTSKSQFLKYVVDFLPRAVYTSGKSSTAAGLTASVVRDPESQEFGIEAGALMLADNGICCIDEFNMMDSHDQVAIHEAMEQQTISIAKAGIQATLNARTSILAAANPEGGRYDQRQTLERNVRLPPPIMSRFDLFFVIVDDSNRPSDYNLARFIVDLHQRKELAINPPLSKDRIQRYIKFARTISPEFLPEAQKAIIKTYVQMRQIDSAQGVNKTAYRITVRQLESIIRLSEALARLHCDDKVRVLYVREAARLLSESIVKVDSGSLDLEGEEGAGDIEKEEPEAEISEEKTPLSISFKDYERISRLLIRYLRRQERKGVAEGVPQSDLINWFLGEEKTLSEGELLFQERRTIQIIKRLVEIDLVLQRVGGTSRDPHLAVHPNYLIEDDDGSKVFCSAEPEGNEVL